MLHTPAPFPAAGCHAMILADPGDPALGQAGAAPSFPRSAWLAVRVLRHTGKDQAVISIPAVPGASGQRTVPISILRDATPLTADERDELASLEKRLTGKARRRRADELRFDALTERAELAPIHARQVRRAESIARDRDALAARETAARSFA